MNKFYVYSYLKTDGSPYYIGKGKNNRAYLQNRHFVQIPKDRKNIKFVAKNLIETDALAFEKLLISKLGRLDIGTGILENKSEGGRLPAKLSPESRNKMSKHRLGKKASQATLDKLKGRIPWNKGKTGVMKTPWNKGKTYKSIPCSEEKKAKLSVALKGRLSHKRTPDQVQKWRETMAQKKRDKELGL